MNYVKGGSRILVVCTALIWLICGGVSVGVAFGEPAPLSLPYADSLWRELLLGTGFGAISASLGFLYSVIDPEGSDGAPPGGFEIIRSFLGSVDNCS